MKKRSSFIFIALLAIAVLTGCQQQEKTSSTTTTTPSTSVSSGAIAYVNIDSIALYYDFYIDLKNKLEQEQIKAERQFASKEAELRGKVNNFQKRAQAGLLSENAIRSEQQQLMEEGQRLELDKQSFLQGIAAQNEKDMTKVFDNIRNVLEEYKKEKGFSIVLGYQKNNPIILYGDTQLDITQAVLDQLNAKYKAEKDSANVTK